MVVGTGAYTNKNEAYPLDNRLLRKVALRSLLVRSGDNAETGESIGWCYAIKPALERIHDNHEDLALALGHNLEYVRTGGIFSTLAMGVVLSLEQEKADLETIRSVRTAAAAVCSGLSKVLYSAMLVPLLAAIMISLSGGGIGILCLYGALLVFVQVLLRLWLIRFGYARGVRAVEIVSRNQDRLKRAARIAGVFTIGALIVLQTRSMPDGAMLNKGTIPFDGLMQLLPGLAALLVTWLCYHLLTKKNWSIGRCVFLLIMLSMLAAVLGIDGTSAIHFPWLS
ncbi:MAG: PTS system mannose/fructose/sorbose family transporter subunit IID [Solobacterium sp.]|nr:PTS system mannose/fructose/sorbose family transporter subunit IID [Solobacterium sp.]